MCSLLPSCRYEGSNSGNQAWHQVPLPSEPSHRQKRKPFCYQSHSKVIFERIVNKMRDQEWLIQDEDNNWIRKFLYFSFHSLRETSREAESGFLLDCQVLTISLTLLVFPCIRLLSTYTQPLSYWATLAIDISYSLPSCSNLINHYPILLLNLLKNNRSTIHKYQKVTSFASWLPTFFQGASFYISRQGFLPRGIVWLYQKLIFSHPLNKSALLRTSYSFWACKNGACHFWLWTCLLGMFTMPLIFLVY